MSAKKKSIQMWELVQLFEDSKHEMYRLLRHSFARFKRGEEFEKIRSYYTKKIEEQLKEEEAKKSTKEKPAANPGDYQKLEDQPSNPVPLHGTALSKDGNGVVEELVDMDDILRDEQQFGTQDTLNGVVPSTNGTEE